MRRKDMFFGVGSGASECDGGKMVVWFFEFIWLLWILTSSEARTTHSGTLEGSSLFIL